MIKRLRKFLSSPPSDDLRRPSALSKERRVAANAQAIETYIGATAIIEGNLIVTGGIRVEGSIFGSIEVRGVNACLVIASQAKVFGDLVADDLIIDGTIQGNVHAKRSLRLDSGAVISGDVRYREIDMQLGSQVNGVFHPIISTDLGPESGRGAKPVGTVSTVR